jgi:hypothetical protein
VLRIVRRGHAYSEVTQLAVKSLDERAYLPVYLLDSDSQKKVDGAIENAQGSLI